MSRRWVRLVACGVVTAGVVLGIAGSLPLLAPRIPVGAARYAAIFFLKAYLTAYLVGLPLAIVGLVALPRSLWKSRQRGERGPRRARVLAVCVSILIGSLLMEALAWAWQARSHRTPDPEVRINDLAAPTPTPNQDLYVVVIGESSAVGMPFDLLISIGQIVAWQLERVFPGRRVFVDTRAIGGYSLDSAVHTLEKPWRKPDVVLLYSGHNEFHSHYELMREVPFYTDDFKLRDDVARRLRRVSPWSI